MKYQDDTIVDIDTDTLEHSLLDHNNENIFSYFHNNENIFSYEDIGKGAEKGIVRARIRDILGEQRMCMIQFEWCVDEFNRYLGAARLLDAILQHGFVR